MAASAPSGSGHEMVQRCACNVLLQVLWFPARPILALTIVPHDLVAMYGLLAHGGQRRAYREARAAGRL